jgi:hypothetical protein
VKADVLIPEDHSEEDLQLAALVAVGLRMKTLLVLWSLEGRYFFSPAR